MWWIMLPKETRQRGQSDGADHVTIVPLHVTIVPLHSIGQEQQSEHLWVLTGYIGDETARTE